MGGSEQNLYLYQDTSDEISGMLSQYDVRSCDSFVNTKNGGKLMSCSSVTLRKDRSGYREILKLINMGFYDIRVESSAL